MVKVYMTQGRLSPEGYRNLIRLLSSVTFIFARYAEKPPSLPICLEKNLKTTGVIPGTILVYVTALYILKSKNQ